MATVENWIRYFESEPDACARTDGGGKERARLRWLRLLAAHGGENGEVSCFSVPGRAEIGGNHTDHNHGRVLAAGVTKDMICAAEKTQDGVIELTSEGYEPFRVDTAQLEKRPEETGTTLALIRGVCAAMAQRGKQVGGFRATLFSDVLPGSGLSSSAAFEVMIATVLDHLYNEGNMSPVARAQVGQYAENVYFGKPSGLMDQTACAAGGMMTIDFCDPAQPVLTKIPFDFSKAGYNLVVTNTRGSHADLTDEYAAITREMGQISARFGKKYLRDVPEAEFFRQLPELHGSVSDRALLRAAHFYADHARVARQAEALEKGDVAGFLNEVVASGRSSFMWLQNCYCAADPAHQGLPLALMASERMLAGKGAWRVQGGGFAGTIQAFVPAADTGTYVSEMEKLFGEGACFPVEIRQVGAVRLSMEKDEA